MYALTRGDLPVGLQMAQVGHALVSACFERAGPLGRWWRGPNNLVVLDAGDLNGLQEAVEALQAIGADVTLFREPDLGDELTAAVVAPTMDVGRRLSNYPLAGREMTMA